MTDAPSRPSRLPTFHGPPRSDPKTLAASLAASVLIHVLAAWWLAILESPLRPPEIVLLEPRPEIVLPVWPQIAPGRIPVLADTVVSRRKPWVQMRLGPLPGTEEIVAEFRDKWQKPALTRPRRPLRRPPPVSFDSLAVRTPQEREAVMQRNFAFIVEDVRRSLPPLDRMGGYDRRDSPNLGMEYLRSPMGATALGALAMQGLVRGVKGLFSRSKSTEEPIGPDLNLSEREIYVLNALWLLGEATPEELYEYLPPPERAGLLGFRYTLRSLARREVVRRGNPRGQTLFPNVERESVLQHFLIQLERAQRDSAWAARPAVASRLASVRRRIALLVQGRFEALDSGG